jgi:hypothetical protein
MKLRPLRPVLDDAPSLVGLQRDGASPWLLMRTVTDGRVDVQRSVNQ